MSDGERARQNDDTTYHESATLCDINITSIEQSETKGKCDKVNREVDMTRREEICEADVRI